MMTDIDLENFESRRHWMGFDIFVWKAKMPDYAVISKLGSTQTNLLKKAYEEIYMNQYSPPEDTRFDSDTMR